MLTIFIVLSITQLSAAQAIANVQTANPTLHSLTCLSLLDSLAGKEASVSFQVCFFRAGSPSPPVMPSIP